MNKSKKKRRRVRLESTTTNMTITYSNYTVRQVVLAVRAEKLGIWNLKATNWTRSKGLLFLCLVWLADNHFNFSLVLEINVIAIFRPHQHCCITEGRIFQACPVALYHSGGQDRNNICDKRGK